jgi:hypothetical protein
MKQANSGYTFIASPFRLAWLDKRSQDRLCALASAIFCGIEAPSPFYCFRIFGVFSAVFVAIEIRQQISEQGFSTGGNLASSLSNLLRHLPGVPVDLF